MRHAGTVEIGRELGAGPTKPKSYLLHVATEGDVPVYTVARMAMSQSYIEVLLLDPFISHPFSTCFGARPA